MRVGGQNLKPTRQWFVLTAAVLVTKKYFYGGKYRAIELTRLNIKEFCPISHLVLYWGTIFSFIHSLNKHLYEFVLYESRDDISLIDQIRTAPNQFVTTH